MAASIERQVMQTKETGYTSKRDVKEALFKGKAFKLPDDVRSGQKHYQAIIDYIKTGKLPDSTEKGLSRDLVNFQSAANELWKLDEKLFSEDIVDEFSEKATLKAKEMRKEEVTALKLSRYPHLATTHKKKTLFFPRDLKYTQKHYQAAIEYMDQGTLSDVKPLSMVSGFIKPFLFAVDWLHSQISSLFPKEKVETKKTFRNLSDTVLESSGLDIYKTK